MPVTLHRTLTPSLSLPNLNTTPGTSAPAELPPGLRDLMRETYLAHSLARDDGQAPALIDHAARALDRLSLNAEHAFAAHTAPAATSLQARADAIALNAFQAAHDKRERFAAHIELPDAPLADALRTLGLPDRNILPDSVILGALPDAARDRLKRALVFVLAGGDTPLSDNPRPNRAQLNEAIARLAPGLAPWANALRGRALAPVAAHTQAHLEREHTALVGLCRSLADCAPEALAEQLDALDECTEDALLFAVKRVVDSEEPPPEVLGIPMGTWHALHDQLQVRERAARAGQLRIDDYAQALRAASPLLSEPALRLATATTRATIMSRVLRSFASALQSGGDPAHTRSAAMTRLLGTSPEGALQRHLTQTRIFADALAQDAPAVHDFLVTLITRASDAGALLNRDPEGMSALIEHTLLDSAQRAGGALDLALRALLDALQDIQRTHRETWQDTLAQLWLQRSRTVGSAAARKLDTLCDDARILGLDAHARLMQTLVRDALRADAPVALRAQEAFKLYEGLPVEDQTRIRRALFAPNGKYLAPVRTAQAALKAAREPHRARLGELFERLCARIRTARPAAPTAAEAQEDTLLEEAISRARTEHARHASGARGVDLESEIDALLAALPRAGSQARRLAALNGYLLSIRPIQFMNLATVTFDREAVRGQSAFADYKRRNGIENWYIERVLPCMQGMSGAIGERVAIGALRPAFERSLAQNVELPVESARNREHADRLLMCSDRIAEVACTIASTLPQRVAASEPAFSAWGSAAQIYSAHARDLRAIPEIGLLLKHTWDAVLQAAGARANDEITLLSVISQDEVIAALCQSAVAQLTHHHHDTIMRAASTAGVRDTLGSIADAARRNIAGVLRESPAQHALLNLSRALLHYMSAQENATAGASR